MLPFPLYATAAAHAEQSDHAQEDHTPSHSHNDDESVPWQREYRGTLAGTLAGCHIGGRAARERGIQVHGEEAGVWTLAGTNHSIA